ncbi:MAG: hypothetical protein ABIN73_04420 [candidate division WOR-3 bacterium]
MRDLFGNEIVEDPIEVNIYADEIQSKECPYTKEQWFYIGIIVEDIKNSLLDDIIRIRYCNNFDKTSPYYKKNNRVIHWVEINDADTKNICKRWFEYILNPGKSERKFYTYILGINNSKLNEEKFGGTDFNTRYNRFFRSTILYALKTFFPNKKIIVKNIFHEKGPQQCDEYFPWHCIYKITEREENIDFECDEILFLPKDHKEDERSNIIQLCDAFMGACISIIHGIKESKRSKYKEELMDLILPLITRMIDEPQNINSKYCHANRIMIRFFPKHKTAPDHINKVQNQFYTRRQLYYFEKKSGQIRLF